jgi:prepilin-type N-terminal cleavage/methylation domain-containing protein
MVRRNFGGLSAARARGGFTLVELLVVIIIIAILAAIAVPAVMRATATAQNARIKTEIESITGALEKLDQVRLVDFRYTKDYLAAHPEIENRRYPNVIAQEFQKVFPEDVKGSGQRLPDGSEILQVDTYPLTI